MRLGSFQVNLILSFIFSTLFNVKILDLYISKNQILNISDNIKAFSFFLFIFFVINSLFTLFNFKYIQKIILCLFILISSPCLYFALYYGILFDTTMLQNLLETDHQEAFDLLTNNFWVTFIITGLLPLAILFKLQITYPPIVKQVTENISKFFIFITLAFVCIYPYYGNISFFVRNNNNYLTNSLLPTAPIRSFFKNMQLAIKEEKISKKILDPKASINYNNIKNKKPRIYVLMIGETAREKTFRKSLYNNASIQDLLLDQENLVYFSNFWSCGTNTALSVPCMFSLYPKSEYRREMNKQYENIADIIQRVGFDVTWRNNNSGCKDVCSNLKNDPITKNNSLEFYHKGYIYDEALIQDLKKRISLKKTDQVIFLHMMGSHGPAYYKRVPEQFKLIQPSCESSNFSDCTQQEIINAYENSILYTKLIINKAIASLEAIDENYDSFLMYLSDHGESTGENGIYLHGIPYFLAPKEQTHIPALIWMSESFKKNAKIDLNCLLNKKQQQFSHDYFSHSLLSLLNISSSVYQEKLDIFYGCKN